MADTTDTIGASLQAVYISINTYILGINIRNGVNTKLARQIVTTNWMHIANHSCSLLFPKTTL